MKNLSTGPLSYGRTNAASHGWTFWIRALRDGLAQARREFLPTDEELDLDYLNGASDVYDLEYRMRELDRSRARGPLFGRR